MGRWWRMSLLQVVRDLLSLNPMVNLSWILSWTWSWANRFVDCPCHSCHKIEHHLWGLGWKGRPSMHRIWIQYLSSRNWMRGTTTGKHLQGSSREGNSWVKKKLATGETNVGYLLPKHVSSVSVALTKTWLWFSHDQFLLEPASHHSYGDWSWTSMASHSVHFLNGQMLLGFLSKAIEPPATSWIWKRESLLQEEPNICLLSPWINLLQTMIKLNVVWYPSPSCTTCYFSTTHLD